MTTNDSDLLNQQRQRRKRINRIKTGIITTIAMWMLFSLLAIIILSVQVYKLHQTVGALQDSVSNMDNIVPGTQNSSVADKDTSTDSDVQSESDETQNSQETESEDPYANIVTGIDTEENFAKEGDVHNVYLTFNCVPGDNTTKILDVLAQYQVKATFFVVGSEDEDDVAIYQRIVNEGHTIGMHSYSNKYSSIYSSEEAFLEDYRKISDLLYELTGVRSSYYRFPGGSSNQVGDLNMAAFAHILNQEKITYFDWNVSAGDAAYDYTVEDVNNNVLEGIAKYKTSVVLLHDDSNKSTTVEALGTLIERLNEQGAKILPIDENTDVIQYIKAESVG